MGAQTSDGFTLQRSIPAYFLLCVAAATANNIRRGYSMARSQIRPRIGVRCGPKVWHYPACR
jgi:hypothetical protein